MGRMDMLARYEYPECSDAPFVPSWSGWETSRDAGGSGIGPAERDAALGKAGEAEFSQRLAEETHRSFEAGRAKGIAEGREAERMANAAEMTSAREERIRQAAEMVAGFERQRGVYFQAVEQETVRLALAVAARILRREALTDPLLLMGAVRVALGQVAASTEVRLRVPPKDLDLWTEAIALLPKLGIKPQVVAGDGMRLGECMIETSLGSADLGIPSQLAEIERSILEQPEKTEADRESSSAFRSLEVTQ